MNREILFRGKRIDNGDWAYGDLMTKYIHHNGLTIVEAGCVYHEVDHETVGQKSGLKERPGIKDIWQGDVVKITLVSFISGKPIATETRMVELRDGMFGVEWGNDKHFMPLAHFAPGTIIEVIGTIHDNPELLEV